MTDEFSLDDVALVHLADKHRYEAQYNNKTVAFAEYVDEPADSAQQAGAKPVRNFNHTFTDPDYGGKGIAGKLVEYALDDAIAAGFALRDDCSYVAHFVEKHPQYQPHLTKN